MTRMTKAKAEAQRAAGRRWTLLVQLRDGGDVLRETREAEAKALAHIAKHVGPAREAGLTVAQIMEATGLARQTIYRMLGEERSR